MADWIARAMAAKALKGGGGGSGGGTTNGLTGVKVNGVAAPVNNQVASITVPTQVSQLLNDSKFVTEDVISATLGDYARESEVVALRKKVTDLEATVSTLENTVLTLQTTVNQLKTVLETTNEYFTVKP